MQAALQLHQDPKEAELYLPSNSKSMSNLK